MLCPACQSDSSRVTDSRAANAGVRRRRECSFCGERFSTMETVLRASLKVLKKDGRSEEFQKEKLLAGLAKAAVKCSVSVSQLENIVDSIETQIYDSTLHEQITTLEDKLESSHQKLLCFLDNVLLIIFT